MYLSIYLSIKNIDDYIDGVFNSCQSSCYKYYSGFSSMALNNHIAFTMAQLRGSSTFDGCSGGTWLEMRKCCLGFAW